MTLSDIQHVQPRAWRLLSKACARDRIAGTYLFYGLDGVGHWPLVQAWSALLNCANPRPSDDGLLLPCEACDHCRQIAHGTFAWLQVALPLPPLKESEDPLEVTGTAVAELNESPFALRPGGSTIPIQVAREMRRRAMLAADKDVRRALVFYHLHLMKQASADALLKLIEEPPPDTVILLTADRVEGLLPTIQSRAHRIRLQRVPETFAISYLASAHNISETKARTAYRLADGILGRAIELVENGEENESDRAVGIVLFRSMCEDRFVDFAGHLMAHHPRISRPQAEDLLWHWQTLSRDCVTLASGGSRNELINADFASELERLAGRIGRVEPLTALPLRFKNTLADFRRNVHIHPALLALAMRVRADLNLPD